jgi:uncharacterized protein YbjT (DUF2867 family)
MQAAAATGIIWTAKLDPEEPSMILVVGATSPVGRPVVDELLHRGQRVRALSRRPEEARLPAGVEVVGGDLADAASLSSVVQGVDAAFVFAGPPEHVETFARAARDGGIRRIVLWSSGAVRDDVEEQPNAIAAGYARMERAVVDSGLEYTIVRVELAAANAILWAADIAGQVKEGDVVRGPYADAAGAPIHERDVAAVVAFALVEDGHGGRRYRLTGPESLTHAEQVEAIGKGIGRRLRYEELAPDEARAMMGLPPVLVEPLFALWHRHVGTPAAVTDDVERVTGRPARRYAEWVADHAADFA